MQELKLTKTYDQLHGKSMLYTAKIIKLKDFIKSQLHAQINNRTLANLFKSELATVDAIFLTVGTTSTHFVK